MHTSLGLNPLNIEKSLRGALPCNGATENMLLAKYYKFFAEHGLSPTMLEPLPQHSSSGAAPTNDLAAGLSPWLDGSGLDGQGFLDTQFPLRDHFPYRTGTATVAASRPTSPTWCASTRATAGAAGPTPTSSTSPASRRKIRLAEKYAQIIHAGSTKAGYREPFLLTDEPRTRTLSGAPPNRVAVERRRHLVPAHLPFLGGPHQPAPRAGQGQAGVVVQLREQLVGPLPGVVHRQAQHRHPGAGVDGRGVGRPGHHVLGLQPLDEARQQRLPRPVPRHRVVWQHAHLHRQRRGVVHLPGLRAGARPQRPDRRTRLLASHGSPAQRLAGLRVLPDRSIAGQGFDPAGVYRLPGPRGRRRRPLPVRPLRPAVAQRAGLVERPRDLHRAPRCTWARSSSV